MKKTRLLLSLGGVSALGSVPLLAVACGTQEDYVATRTVRSASNTEFKPIEFEADPSNEYGGFLDTNKETLGAYLLRKRTVGKPEILRDANATTGAVTYKVTKPSVWSYKFEYVAKVIVTLTDGTVKEFDKDDASLTVQPTNGAYSSAYIQGRSNDERSINSDAFDTALKNATKLQFELKTGQKWVNFKGEQTKYDVVPKDFWISLKRTELLGVADRAKAASGTSVNTKELDSLLKSLASQGSTYYTENRRYPNSYIYGLYDVDYAKVGDEASFIEDGKITFHKTPTATRGQFDLFIDGLIVSSKEFVAAPSQYIEELTRTNKIPTLKPFNNNATTVSQDAIKNIPADNILARTGTYWYGFNKEDVLYAGPYLYKGYVASAQEERWTINPFYHDQEFVKSPKSVQNLALRYQGQGDASAFKAFLWDDYSKGRFAKLGWNNVEEKLQKEIVKAPHLHGLEYNQALNKGTLASEQGWELLPAVRDLDETTKDGKLVKFNPEDPAQLKKALDSITYNDNFARVAYGKTKEQLVKDALKGSADLVSLFTGKGVAFRSLLSAAINYEQVTRFATESKSKMWVAYVAQDSKIGGTDQATAEYKTPREAYEELHKLKFIKSDLTLSTEKTSADYVRAVIDSQSELDKLKSPHFAEIKAEIKKLLDEAGIGKDEKVSWQQTYRWINWNPVQFEQIYKLLPALYKELDPRLDMKGVKYEREQASTFWEQHLSGRSPFAIGGWSYDADNVGSGLDGIVNSYHSTLPLLILSQTTADATAAASQAKLKASLPALFKLSEEFNKWIKAEVEKGAFTLSIDIDKLKDTSLLGLWKLHEHLDHYTINEQGQVVELTQDQVKATNVDLPTLSARFLNSYVQTLTNAQILEVVKEFRLWHGLTAGRQKGVSVEGFNPVLINKHYKFPFTGTERTWEMDIEVEQDKPVTKK
ncbi:OppA family ABC transporter substrate-binding lipoprotein [Mycoplasma simbae]|uniref:OppA family ABC transporter substrate-binding lipoprotein n=1 Tax=Mycoplasma simbae TaxID=36744 RepID=UPI000497B419|nr:variable surface lipoprotein [Mycoplasma simbae]